MAAGLGFKTFNTGDVLSAVDVNGYLMQGVWVFADAATRTSVVTSPQEGNVSFLKDTNSLEIYDGANWVAYGAGDITAVTAGTGISGGGTSGSVTITNSMATAIDAKGDLIVGTGSDTFSRLAVGGTNGHVLTVDSGEATGMKWAAAGSSGALTLVTQASFTTQSTINVNNCFSSTYDNYLLIVDISSVSTTNMLLNFRLRASGTDASGANYSQNFVYQTYNSATPLGLNTSGGTEWFGFGISSTANPVMNFLIDLRKPALATRTFMNTRYAKADQAGSDNGSAAGFHGLSTAYDGFTLYTSTGTVTGSYKVYGYQNS